MKKILRNHNSTPPRAVLVASVVVLSAILLSGYGLYGLFRNQSMNQATTNTVGVVAAASTTSIGPYTIEAHRIKWQTAEDGKTYLLIAVSVHNTSQEVQQFSPLLQTKVIDANGTSYEFTADENTAPMGGPISPGETASGTLDYQLPITTAPLQLYFRASPTDIDHAITIN